MITEVTMENNDLCYNLLLYDTPCAASEDFGLFSVFLTIDLSYYS